MESGMTWCSMATTRIPAATIATRKPNGGLYFIIRYSGPFICLIFSVYPFNADLGSDLDRHDKNPCRHDRHTQTERGSVFHYQVFRPFYLPHIQCIPFQRRPGIRSPRPVNIGKHAQRVATKWNTA